MNREIKFRGKRVDTSEWIYGCLVVNPYETSICDESSVTYGRYDVDPETVGQYIGLKDKNNTEIYEGDILKNGDDEVTLVYADPTWPPFKDAHSPWWPEDCEVIGNISDTPELLKEANDV